MGGISPLMTVRTYRDRHFIYICHMRKLPLILLSIACISIHAKADYIDHRGHNVDSLETVMAGWTAKAIGEAEEPELKSIAEDIEGLMYGFNQTNPIKSEYYARMLLDISRSMGWHHYEELAAKSIGQHFWAREKYDSAAFYYGIAMKAVERMSEADAVSVNGGKFDQKTIDDALSQMYGTLGNLYSAMDSTDTAMAYYEKAGELFEKYGWYSSSAVLYYNMGETMRNGGDFRKAEDYYQESLRYSRLTGDSLDVATAFKGLGSLYLDTHKISRSIRYLNDANKYFANHEDEELQSRMESLEYTEQVRVLQNKRLIAIIMLLAALLLMSAATLFISKRLKRELREKKEISQVLEDTVLDIRSVSKGNGIRLKAKEKQVLDLIAKGYTNIEIAEAMCLSPETIKWYKKKLFATFGASNSAELIKNVTESGLL